MSAIPTELTGRVVIKRIAEDEEWAAMLPAFNEVWQEMRDAQPELEEVPMGGLMIRGHHARFVYGAPEGGPARFLGRDRPEFDLSRPEDLEKFIERADVLKEFIWAGGEWWECTLDMLKKEALALLEQ